MSRTPFVWLYCPVKIVARLGVQIEFVQNTFSNNIPSAARRSIVGVISSPRNLGSSYAPIPWQVWSSDMMNKMFGTWAGFPAVPPAFTPWVSKHKPTASSKPNKKRAGRSNR